MLSQEEIRIKAGLDYSKVTAGLTDIRAQVYKLAKDVPKALSGILKANVFAGAAGLISEILPTWDDIWNRVYGVDEAATKRLEQQGANLKKIRDNLDSARKGAGDMARDSQFNSANTQGKLAILDAELDTSEKAKKSAFEKWQFAKAHNVELEKTKALETEYWKSVSANIKARDALTGFQSKLQPSDLKTEFDRQMDATRNQVVADRNTIRAVNEAFQSGEGTPELASLRDKARGRIGGVVQARSLNGLGNVASRIPDIEMFSAIKDSLITAQQEGMKAVIQRVKIVEVE